MSDKKLWEQYVALEKERDALRAKMADFDGDFYEVRQMSLYKDNEPLQGQTALYALPGAKEQEPTRDWWDCLISDISAIDCMYRGSPTYAHDAYWMREHVVRMLEQRRDASPSAPPAPSVPDATWLPVPDKHPTFDHVDLKLADGSVLCGCVPQSDGDYWWKGPSGEVFIDPRYAPVTHWRLSASPDAKP